MALPKWVWDNDTFQLKQQQQQPLRYRLVHRNITMGATTNNGSATTLDESPPDPHRFHTQQRQQRRLTHTIHDDDEDHAASTSLFPSHHPHHYHRYILPPDLFTPETQHPVRDDDDHNDYNHSSIEILQQPPPQHTIEIPIIIQLSGEFGNHLSKLAAGIGVAAMIHAYNPPPPPTPPSPWYRFTTNLHVRHQDHTTKGDTAIQLLQHCFPNLLQIQEDVDVVMAAIVNETTLLHHATPPTTLSSQNIPYEPNHPYRNINSHLASEVDATIYRIIQDAINAYEATTTLRNDASMDNGTSQSTTTTSPFPVYSNHLVGYFDVYMDRFYDVYRQYFIINATNPTCGCLATTYHVDDPRPAEIVFYYRGYQVEMPKKAIALGYEEISPTALVSYLHNITTIDCTTTTYRNPPPSVRIVSRFPNHTQPYVLALTDVGYSVQVVPHGNNPNSHSSTSRAPTNNAVTSILHDFCTLRRATKFIIGPIRSTYYMWATILADHDNGMKRNTIHERCSSPTSSLHVTAYTTPSQIDWALKQHEALSSKHSSTTSTTTTTAAFDSISPTNYYDGPSSKNSIDSDHPNYSYESLWKERNFHFVTLQNQ